MPVFKKSIAIYHLEKVDDEILASVSNLIKRELGLVNRTMGIFLVSATL